MGKYVHNETFNITVGIEEIVKGNAHTIYIDRDGQKKFVLSKYNPDATIDKMIGEDFGNKETIWIVLGYGLGYAVEKLRKKIGKENRILIIEPGQEELDLQIQYHKEECKQTFYFAGDDFVLLNRILMTLIGKKQINNLKILQHDVYTEAFSGYYKEVIRVIKEAILQNEVAYNTDEAFNLRFINNVLENQSYIMESKDISQHYNKYTNIPAVIVSAGPSLDKNIQYIKDFSGIIITGGRTLEKVFENKVEPDFLVSIDPKPEAYELLGKYKKNSVPLVTVAAGEPQILQNHTGNHYFVDHGGYNGMVKQFLGTELPHMAMGSSVATLCLSLAHYLGCNPIIFIGQDLAYTDFKTHADTWQAKTVEQNATFQYIDGYYGEKVPSESSLITFLRWIEQFIDSTPDRVYINATEGGAYIKGTQQMTFEEVVNQYKDTNKNVIHEDIKLFDEDESAIAMQNTINILQRLKSICRAGIKITEKILNEYKMIALRYDRIDKLTLDLNNIITKEILKIQESQKGIGVLIVHAQIKVSQFSRFKEQVGETSLEANQRGVRKQRQFYIEIIQSIEVLEKILNKHHVKQ